MHNKDDIKNDKSRQENIDIKGYNPIVKTKNNFPGKLKFKFDPYYDAISKVKGEVPYKGANRCINCGKCVTACPNNARKLDFPNMSVDEMLCINCGACLNACPTGALTAAFSE